MLSENYLHRFGGIARLYGRDGLQALADAHVAVVGLGGVGTWAAEALARSGVGEITLIELDDVCLTNSNRQLHAMEGEIGRPKNTVISERLQRINPELKLHSVHDFLTRNNIDSLLAPSLSAVIDAVDSAAVKAAMVAWCSRNKVRLVMSGSSGGKRDPLQVTVKDLGQTISDPMLAKVRNILYRHYNFARSRKRQFRVDAVYSTEQMVYPKPDGSVCQEKAGLEDGVRLDCAGGFGAATMITGTFGFAAASKAVERILQKKSDVKPRRLG